MSEQMPTQPAAPYTGQQQAACPLCVRTGRSMRKPKLLYGHYVCKKCSSGFANRRQFAYFIDIILFQAISLVIGITLVTVMTYQSASEPDVQIAGRVVGIALLPLLLFKDGFSGFSPGKALMGVRVINSTTGQPAGFGASFKRNLILLIPLMPIIVAFLLIKGKRIGDGWAHTKVIRNKYAYHPIFAPNGLVL